MKLYKKVVNRLYSAVIIVGILCTAGFVISANPAETATKAYLTLESEVTDSLLASAKLAFDDGLYDIAEKHLRHLSENPNLSAKLTEEVLILWIRTLLEQGRYKEAIDLLETKPKWTKRIKNEDTFAFWRVMIDFRMQKWEDALSKINAFKTNYKESPYIPHAIRLAGRCYVQLGKIDEAVQSFSTFDSLYSTMFPQVLENLLDWGKTLIVAGKVQEAEQILKRLTTAKSDLPVVHEGVLWLAKLLTGNQRLNEATNLLYNLTETEAAKPDIRAMAYLELANIFETAGLTNSALSALSNSVTVAESPYLKAKANSQIGYILTLMGQLEEGIRLMKPLANSPVPDPLVADIQLKIGKAYLNNGKYEEAVSEFRKYLETFTNSTGQAEAYEGMGWALSQMKRHAESATAFGKAFELHTNSEKKAVCLFKMGDAYFENQQYSHASNVYYRVTVEYPKSQLLYKAQKQLAECLAASGHFYEAERAFSKLSAECPVREISEEALLRAGEMCNRLGELGESGGIWIQAANSFNKAVEMFNQVISISNTVHLPRALYGRGIAFYRLFKPQKAMDDFTRVVQDFPDTIFAEHASYLIGTCYYLMARDQEAIQAWKNFTEKFKNSPLAPRAVYDIAMHLFNTGDYINAESNFYYLAKTYSTNQLADDALLRAAQSAIRRKEYTRANEYLVLLSTTYPASNKVIPARLEQGNVLRLTGAYSEAILVFEEIIKKNPERKYLTLAWLGKGDCQHVLGTKDKKRYNEAIESYRAVINTEPDIEFVLEACYKIGKCLEDMGKPAEALEQYYSEVIARYLENRKKKIWMNDSCKKWFARAVLNSADICEAQKEWTKAVNILEHLANAGIEASEEARARIQKIKTEHWTIFGY
jgi:TolA-binding protein